MGLALGELTTGQAQGLDKSGLTSLVGQYVGIPANQMDGLQDSFDESDLRACASLFDVNNLPDNASTNFVVQKDQRAARFTR